MATDSQELKYRIEGLINHLNADVDHNLDQVHIGEVQLLWDFVEVVKDRAYEPCIQDICERLLRLSQVPQRKAITEALLVRE